MTSDPRTASTTSLVTIERRFISKDALNLGDEAAGQAEVPAGDAGDRGAASTLVVKSDVSPRILGLFLQGRAMFGRNPRRSWGDALADRSSGVRARARPRT